MMSLDALLECWNDFEWQIQKPRVLPLCEFLSRYESEGENVNKPVWLERREVDDEEYILRRTILCNYVISTARGLTIEGEWFFLPRSGYNVTWRCWDHPATWEEMQNEPWGRM